MDLGKDKETTLYRKYLLPTLCAMVFNAVYILTDTLMIGRGIGEEALVALNLLLPVFSLYFGAGYLFGVGGSVLLSVAKGNQDEEEQKRIFTTTVFVAVIVGIIASVIPYLAQESIYSMLGVSESNVTYAREYGSIFFACGGILILQPVIISFVRNDEAPKCAMAGTVVGSSLNVILDYIFIYKLHFGMAGAISATIIGNTVNLCIGLSHLFTKRNHLHFSWKYLKLSRIGKVMKNGASPCFNEVAWGIVVFVFNQQIIAYFEDYGLVIYSIISNILIVTNSFLNAAGNAMQPLVSYNLGAGRIDRIKRFAGIGFLTITGITILMYGFIFWKTNLLVHLFVDPSPEVIKEGIPAVRIYFLSLFLAMVNVYGSIFFQAMVKPKFAMTISLLRGFLLSILFVLVLPVFFGADSIWWVMMLAEGCTMLVTVVFFRMLKLGEGKTEY
ncbi:MAG: MATE family efflux transporter [Lachnospiraceae bacterium]